MGLYVPNARAVVKVGTRRLEGYPSTENTSCPE